MINPVKFMITSFKRGGISGLNADLQVIKASRKRRHNRRTAKDKLRKKIQKRNYIDKYEIAVLITGKDEELIETTINSLMSQTFDKINIYKVNDSSDIERTINNLSEEFFCLSYAGDTFDEILFGAFSCIIDEHENVTMVYTDENIDGREVRKPAWSPDTLSGHNYIGHFALLSTEVAKKYISDNGTDKDLDNLIWNIEKSCGENVVQIPAALMETKVDIRTEFLKYQNIPVYNVGDDNLISIIIASKDNPKCLSRLLESIKKYTGNIRYEIILVDNGSNDENKKKVAELCDTYNVRYLYEPMPFNFSKMCNLGRKDAKGNLFLFLNDDTEVKTDNWLYILAGEALMPKRGAIGARLLYPGGKLQHGGVALLNGLPVYIMKEDDRVEYVDLVERQRLPYNYSVLTAACLMVRSNLFDAVGGFDELFPNDYNDVDFCLKLLKRGYHNCIRNDVILTHYESLSRGSEFTKAKLKEIHHYLKIIHERYVDVSIEDMYYREPY